MEKEIEVTLTQTEVFREKFRVSEDYVVNQIARSSILLKTKQGLLFNVNKQKGGRG